MHSYLALIDIGNSATFAPSKIVDIGTILNFIIPVLSIIGAVLFLGMMLFGAFTWLTAGEKPENVQKAWKIMTFAVAGLLVVFLSYLALKIIGLVLGTGVQPF